MISPNMLQVGQSNEYAFNGPIGSPNVQSEMLTKFEKIYSGWFRIWNTCNVPKSIQQPN